MIRKLLNRILFMFLVLAVTDAVTDAVAQDAADPLRTLDGSISDEEAARGRVILRSDSTTIRIAADDAYLYLAVRAEPLAVASLCVHSGQLIHVIHASAALGMVSYESSDDGWTTDDEFEWGLRSSEMTDEVLAERRAHLEQFGWVATTMDMGTPGEVEFLIRRDALHRDSGRLAAGLMPSERPDEILALPGVGAGDCALHELVAGSVPQGLSFDSSAWPELHERRAE